MPRRLADSLQVDRPLVMALAARVWQAISGPVTILFLIASLSLPEQGVYYALVNLVGIQAFFELGLLNVLISHAGHESAGLNRDDAEAARRMAELIRASRRWFAGAAGCFVMLGYGVGWYSLGNASADVAWRWPYACLLPLAAFAFYLSPSLAILEGAGYRHAIYRYRLEIALAGSLVMWAALAAGAKLWALVAATAVQSLGAAFLILVRHRHFFARFRGLPRPHRFAWVTDVLPMQWRMATASLVAHVATHYFSLIVLTFHSDREAAPLGMTLSVTLAIQMLAMAWVQTKFPLVAAHHGGGDSDSADAIWRRTAIVSGGLLVAGLAALAGLVTLLARLDDSLGARFLPPSLIAWLGVGCVANHAIALQGFAVLARRANPLVVPLTLGFAVTAVAVWVCGYRFATEGLLVAYALSLTLCALPLHTWAYRRFLRRRSADR